MKIFKLLNQIERVSARLQGKGYGSATIRQEVKCVHQLLKCRPKIGIDIGGNIGDYTAELLRLTDDLEVHIFEPSIVNLATCPQRGSGRKDL